jgi:hypothetical protein
MTEDQREIHRLRLENDRARALLQDLAMHTENVVAPQWLLDLRARALKILFP